MMSVLRDGSKRDDSTDMLREWHCDKGVQDTKIMQTYRNIWVPPTMLVCCRSYLQEETVIHHLDRLYFAQCNEREGGMATKGAKGGDDSSE